jgi:hypothetical protein
MKVHGDGERIRVLRLLVKVLGCHHRLLVNLESGALDHKTRSALRCWGEK